MITYKEYDHAKNSIIYAIFVKKKKQNLVQSIFGLFDENQTDQILSEKLNLIKPFEISLVQFSCINFDPT